MDEIIKNARFHRRLALSLTGDENEAEDLVQDGWLTAMQSPPRHRGATGSWMSRVLRNRFLERRRAQQNRLRREQVAARPEVASTQTHDERQELIEAVVRHLRELSPEARQVVLLRYYDGLSIAEIAKVLNVPKETVRTRRRRALKELRSRLDGHCKGDRARWMAILAPIPAPPPPAPMPVGRIPVGDSIMHPTLATVTAAVILVSAGATWYVLGSDSDDPGLPHMTTSKATVSTPPGDELPGMGSPSREPEPPPILSHPFVAEDEMEPGTEHAPASKDALSGKQEGKPRVVSVIVVDAEGQPVAGAGVEALASYRPVASAKTNEEGGASLTIPAGRKVQWVLALKPGAGLDYYAHPWWPMWGKGPKKEVPEQVKLCLDGAQTVRIRAVDVERRPIAGARFVPWILCRQDRIATINLSGSRLASAITDGEGVATLDWLPEKSWLFQEPASTFLVKSDKYHWPEMPFPTSGSQGTVELKARLVKKTTIRGTVLLPHGGGAGGLRVVAEGRGETANFCRASTRTDASGRFRLNVAMKQSYVIAVVDEEWAATLTNVFVDDKSASGCDLHLTKGILIHGKLLRGESAKKPVAGELVLLGVENPDMFQTFKPFSSPMKKLQSIGLVRRVRTSADGSYSFRVASGTYFLGAVAGNPSAVHTPKRLVVDEQADIKVDMESTSTLPPFGITGAPINAAGNRLVDYAWHAAFVPPSSNACITCHRPHKPVSTTGR